jgi:aspartokinase-like uncharacterized kinase
MSAPIQVIKIGGSLLDLPDLPVRITSLLDETDQKRTAMIIGGGQAADMARQWDKLHHVGETAGHWLAVQAMQFNMHLVASVLDQCSIVQNIQHCEDVWQANHVALIDPVAWVSNYDEQIPRHWTFTSDSIAAHIAMTLSAADLLLVKSTLPSSACDISRAVELGIVDKELEQAAGGIPRIELINLREQPAARCVVQSSA